MSPADFVVIAVLALLLVLALAFMTGRLGGKKGCCGGCAGCSSAGACGISSQQQAQATHTFRVEGLQCERCAKAVEQALAALPGVSLVHCDAKTGTGWLKAEGEVSPQSMAQAVEKAGYRLHQG